jgi:histidyl-tRNA synthetase
MKYANSINAKKTLIVGPEELKNDMVTIKNMQTGKQEQIKIDKIIDIFSES